MKTVYLIAALTCLIPTVAGVVWLWPKPDDALVDGWLVVGWCLSLGGFIFFTNLWSTE